MCVTNTSLKTEETLREGRRQAGRGRGTKTERREGKKGTSCSKSIVDRKETVSSIVSTEHNPLRSCERKAVCEGCRRMWNQAKERSYMLQVTFALFAPDSSSPHGSQPV